MSGYANFLRQKRSSTIGRLSLVKKTIYMGAMCTILLAYVLPGGFMPTGLNSDGVFTTQAQNVGAIVSSQ
jgi:hypothetical protein